ncbi:MAG: DUF2490 domain-containing protein [Bacteroidota bacterium]
MEGDYRAEFWGAGELKYRVNKRLRIGWENQFRMQNYAPGFDRWFSQLEARARVGEWMDLGLGFRYVGVLDESGANQGYRNHFRWHFDVGGKFKMAKRLNMRLRFRYQNRNEIGRTKAKGDRPHKDMRFRAAFAYNIRKWKLDPELALEAFHHAREGAVRGFNQYRIRLSTEYKISKLHRLKPFFMLEKERVPWGGDLATILGLRYTFFLDQLQK